MGGGFEKEYIPNPQRAAKYINLFREYMELGSLIENG
jgi:hypothetical protein